MDSDPLAEQIIKCQNGEREAFAWLLRQYGSRLYRFFLRMNYSPADAEDLLQDLFVKLLEKIHGYNHQGRFESWLFCVAANLARNEYRRRRRRGGVISMHDEQSPLGEALVSTEATAPEKLQLTEQIDQLQDALEQLSPPERELIILRHYGKLSFKEIAEQYRMPIGTVLAKVHRSLKHIRNIMLENEKHTQNLDNSMRTGLNP